MTNAKDMQTSFIHSMEEIQTMAGCSQEKFDEIKDGILALAKGESMTNDEIMKAIREGLNMQIQEAIEREDVDQYFVQQVTQSYLLLQLMDRLDNVENEISKLNPEYK